MPNTNTIQHGRLTITNDPSAHCPTCTRRLDQPSYRKDARGHVIDGCVDAAHTGHVSGELYRWHARPVARSIRAEANKSLRALGIRPMPAGYVAI